MNDFILRILNINVLNPYDMNRIECGLPVRLVSDRKSISEIRHQS